MSSSNIAIESKNFNFKPTIGMIREWVRQALFRFEPDEKGHRFDKVLIVIPNEKNLQGIESVINDYVKLNWPGLVGKIKVAKQSDPKKTFSSGYSYCFLFYKPGKKFFDGWEIKKTLKYLGRLGFSFRPFSSLDPHIHGIGDEELEIGGLVLKTKEIAVDLELEKSGYELGFHLHPAQESLHGAIGGFFMPEEEFNKDQKGNARLFFDAAMIVFAGLKPSFAWGDHELELDRLSPFLRFDRIGALAWGNIFGKEFVERLGGVRNVISVPTPEAEKDASWFLEKISGVPLGLSFFPNEIQPAEAILYDKRRFPGVILRSFENSYRKSN